MLARPILRTALAAFRRAEEGAITVLNIFLLMVLAILAGLAVDMNNLIQARAQLQIAADTAAHAALYTRDLTMNAELSKTKAIEMAKANMPSEKYGDVLREENIHFGTWDRDAQVFTIDETRREAVYVKTDRLSANANPVSSFLLQFIGYKDWDVVTPSVFETYRPTCLREGFVAENTVDIQSNNGFTNGFCIHSNKYVSVNQNNLFEPGTIVSMPNMGDLDLPSSGFESNEGLQAALREGRLRLRILSRLQDIVDGMTDSSSRYYRDDILINATPVPLALNNMNNAIGMADLKSKRVNVLTCKNGNAKITFNGETFSNIVLITNCQLKASAGTAFEDATIITTNTAVDSITAPSGLRLGKDDGCAAGGGAQLMTFGGISQAAKVEMYGSQLIAAKAISFAAANDGIEGASIISGQTIDVTSGSKMGFCGSGMDSIFEAEYFRMAS